MVELLFVDDESRVLDGLRRMLLAERGRWNFHFAGNGAEALNLLAQQPVDVVVTDMRMPEMDGATLLAEVSTRYPSTVRIVLSGQSDSASAIRALGSAHQYLSKPCDRSTLVTVIERALALRSLLTNQRMREVLHRIGALPPVPQTYAQIARLLGNPDSSLEQIQEVVRRDSGLAGKVLHMANSAYFGRSGNLTSLTAALGLLGTRMLRNLVLTAEMSRDFSTMPTDLELSVETLQEHSLQVAEVASRLERGAVWGEDAYLAGLLHDMGLLVIGSRLPDEFRRIDAECRQTGEERLEVERRVLGCHHGEIGAYLFGLWGLPGIIVEAVGAHADLEFGPNAPLDAVRAVAAAEELVGAAQSLDLAASNRSRFGGDPRWPAWLAIAHDVLSREAA